MERRETGVVEDEELSLGTADLHLVLAHRDGRARSHLPPLHDEPGPDRRRRAGGGGGGGAGAVSGCAGAVSRAGAATPLSGFRQARQWRDPGSL